MKEQRTGAENPAETEEEKLARLEFELQQHYCQIGKCVLELAVAEQRAVGDLIDEIIMTRHRIAVAQGEKRCEECLAYNTPGSIYCKRCGARLNETENEYGHK